MPRWPRGLHRYAQSLPAVGAFSRRIPTMPIEAYGGTITQVPLNDGQGQTLIGAVGNRLSGVGTWVVGSNCTITVTGPNSFTETSLAAGNMWAVSTLDTLIRANGLAVSPGQTVYCQVGFQAVTVARSCQTGVAWYNSAGTYLSTSFGTATADTVGSVTKVTATLVAPANAAFCLEYALVQATAGAGEQHTISNPYLSLSPFTTYGATVTIGPQGLGTTWYPAAVTVSTTSGVNDASVCNVYAGPAGIQTPTTLLGTIPTGGAGTLAAAVPPLPTGWSLTAVWTGANAGDTASINVQGSKDARVMG